MLRNVSLDEISDGRLYDENDMVKVYCDDCRGCHACCQGMGNSIVLDPLDAARLSHRTGKEFAAMIGGELELSVVDGLVLPNIRMNEKGACPFLNSEGRCSIHDARPGFCRLFPLGRYYEEGGFKYILQIHECPRAGRAKVKVSKWLGEPNLAEYTKYINGWHSFQKKLQAVVTEHLASGRNDDANRTAMLVLQYMYGAPYQETVDFYEQFYQRTAAVGEACRL